MSDSLSKKESISLVGCEVRARRCEESEIRLNEGTTVQSSPLKFNKGSLVVQKQAPATVEVNDLSSLSTNQTVTLTVKVKKVEAPEKVKLSL